MRILIVSRYFPPCRSIASLRPYSWAKYWSRMGHRVSVLTWDGGKTRRCIADLGGENVEIVNVENRIYTFFDKCFQKLHHSGSSAMGAPNSGRFLSPLRGLFEKIIARQHDCRMPHIHDLWKHYVLREIVHESWDLVVSTYAPPVAHAIAFDLKRQGVASSWVADYRDLWLGHHVAKGTFPFTLFEQMLEKRYLLSADVVTTVSEPLADVLRRNHPSARVEVVPNGFDSDDLVGLLNGNIFSANKVTLVYTGTIYKGSQDPSPLFEAIASVSKNVAQRNLLDSLKVLFVGGGNEHLMALAEKFEVMPWVDCRESVDREEALRMQRDAHVLIFLEWTVPGVEGIVTGKLFEYLNSGTEIWSIGISNSTEAGKLILSSGTGRLFGTDAQAIRLALIDLLESGKKKAISPQTEILGMYDRKLLAKKMLDLARVKCLEF